MQHQSPVFIPYACLPGRVFFSLVFEPCLVATTIEITTTIEIIISIVVENEFQT